MKRIFLLAGFLIWFHVSDAQIMFGKGSVALPTSFDPYTDVTWKMALDPADAVADLAAGTPFWTNRGTGGDALQGVATNPPSPAVVQATFASGYGVRFVRASSQGLKFSSTTTTPQVYEVWIEFRTPASWNGNQNLLSSARSTYFTGAGLLTVMNTSTGVTLTTSTTYVLRMVINGASSIYQLDAGSETGITSNGQDLGVDPVLCSSGTGSGSYFDGYYGAFFATGTPLSAPNVANMWAYFGGSPPPDTTPPTYSSNTITGIGATAFTLSTTTDEDATVYYSVVADAASAPSVAQVKLGQNAAGSAALFSGSHSGFTVNQLISGATASTAYDVYHVARDVAGNDQAAVTKLDVTTTSGTSPSTIIPFPISTRNDVAVATNPDGYIEYLPENFDPSGATKYPTLYWLHGVGEAGNGSDTTVSPFNGGGLDKVYKKHVVEWLKTHDVPFIVFVPQDHNGLWGTRIEPFVEWTLEEYADFIDTTQMHMAGLSGGGYGIRNLIRDSTAIYDKFSTFTPMATDFNPILATEHYNKIVSRNQYIWFHHGTADGTISINKSTNFHLSLYAIAPTRTRMTAYDGLGHSAWDKVDDYSGTTYPQLTGLISGVQYYEWVAPDDTWWEWMLTHVK
jgi:hypothetical protein